MRLLSRFVSFCVGKVTSFFRSAAAKVKTWKQKVKDNLPAIRRAAEVIASKAMTTAAIAANVAKRLGSGVNIANLSNAFEASFNAFGGVLESVLSNSATFHVRI